MVRRHFLYFLVFSVASEVVASAGNPLASVQVTLRGKVYRVHQATGIRELQDRLQEESGLDAQEQGRVTFQGQVLEAEDDSASLSDCGVKDGDQINMVPASMADHWTMMRDMGKGLVSLQNKVYLQGPFASPEDKEQVEVLSDLYEDMMTKTPFLPEEMERFSQKMQNPDTLEKFQDPQWIESLRQVTLNNPALLRHLIETTPVVQEAVQNREDWYHFVVDSTENWKSLSGYELWQRFSEGRIFEGGN